MKKNWDVIVVGAGLAGLTAGATAALGGVDTVVLEAHQAGGRARTLTKGAYVFNMGAHAFYLGGPGARVLRTLGIETDGVPGPFARYKLLKDGGLHLMPSGVGSLLRTTAMGSGSKAQFGRLLGLLPTIRADELMNLSVDEWIVDHDMRPDVAAILRALIRLSTFCADTREFSAGAAVGQLQIGSREGVSYLHGGWSQLIDALSRKTHVESGCPILAVEPDGDRVNVRTADVTMRGRRVIIAAGLPSAAQSVLPEPMPRREVGPPITAACLDLGVSRVPSPGYCLSVDEPLSAVTQSPPARQCPEGRAVVQAIRYGTSDRDSDRRSLEDHVARIGVGPGDVEERRFLARMVVAGSIPRAADDGLHGRPRVTDSGYTNIYLAGDWVGAEGLLADASIASGHEAARRALADLDRAAARVA